MAQSHSLCEFARGNSRWDKKGFWDPWELGNHESKSLNYKVIVNFRLGTTLGTQREPDWEPDRHIQ